MLCCSSFHIFWKNNAMHHTHGFRPPMARKTSTYLTTTVLPHSNPSKKNHPENLGCLLYYALAVETIMLVALGNIASKQSKATCNTRKAFEWRLDYAVNHTQAKIRYEASDMALWSHRDSSYLSVKQARTWARAIFFLG